MAKSLPTQSSSLAWLAMLGWSVSSESSASAYLMLLLSYPFVVWYLMECILFQIQKTDISESVTSSSSVYYFIELISRATIEFWLHWIVLLFHWIKIAADSEWYSIDRSKTVVNCSNWWYGYWIQLELHFVSSITDFQGWIWMAVEYKTAYSWSVPKGNVTNFQDQCIKCTS